MAAEVSARAASRHVWTAAGLCAMVAANVVYRRYFEHAPAYLFSFLDTFYPGVAERLLSTAPWRLFLPIPEMTGAWVTTTLILSHFVEKTTSLTFAWLLFNAILIVSSFLLAIWVFGSRVFAFTFALLMGFGTALYHTYAVSGSIGFCLLFVYYELTLASVVRLLSGDRRRRVWAAFGVGTLLTVLSYEGWLDFLVFSWIASAYAGCVLWRAGRIRSARLLAVLDLALTAIGLVYMYVKIRHGFGQAPGSESDVVFNYPVFAPAVEDVISNIITHAYMGLTVFLPPATFSSTALVELGGDRLVALQRGYHEPFSYLVPMHYLFFWRYFAGAAFVMLLAAVWRTARRSWRTLTPDDLALTLFLLMILTGGPTHSLVKFRPMNSAPVLSYHVMVGALGSALLISYLAMIAWTCLRDRRAAVAVVAAIWSVALYGSFTRPARLSAMAAQVGLGVGLYPDPMRTAAHEFAGVDLPTPPGAALYQLQRVPVKENRVGLVEEGVVWLPPLSQPLPDPGSWKAAVDAVTVFSVDSGLRISGDRSQIGRQIVSPAVVVPPGRRVRLRMRTSVEAGRVCAGVLDASQQQWVMEPSAFRQEYQFETGPNDRVAIAVANCAPRITDNTPSRFTFYGGSFAVVDPK